MPFTLDLGFVLRSGTDWGTHPLGTMRFSDGTADAATVQLAYDQLDFTRDIEAFFKGMSATSVYACARVWKVSL